MTDLELKPAADRRELLRRALPWAVVVVVALVVGFLGGWLSRSAPEPVPAAGTTDATPTTWTCSMHPTIQSSEPGLCPICGMELIPVSPGGAGGPRVLALSPMAVKLAEIETVLVERRNVTNEIRLVGKVDFDETRLSYITAWFPGRLDRLYVDYTGTVVSKGDHLVDIYSPQLLSAQQELLQAIKALDTLRKGGSKLLLESAEQTVRSSREKLRLWGLGRDQIEGIERTRKTSDHITVRAPIGGVVVHKNKNNGEYVKTGERVYTIADLSQVWVKLDAYESDLSWIRYGQRVSFETEAYPGRPFEGRVVLVDPVLEEATRTVKLRLNVKNADGRLKPGMFVRAVLRTPVSEAGKPLDTALAGKWICPMHGEVIKAAQGACDLCGMPLVPAESIHPVASPVEEAPLVVPAAAVLWTGVRSVVYVRLPGDEPTFEGHEVTLGPRAGDYWVIRGGLKEGDRVVTKGAFKIDSALQIQARPSMMLPPPRKPGRIPAAPQVLRAFGPTYAAYGETQRALAGDDLDGAKAAATRLLAGLGQVDLGAFKSRAAKAAWVAIAARTRSGAKELAAAGSIAAARGAFLTVSKQILTLERRLGHASPGARYEVYCSMAFDNAGASWLQDEKKVANPYYGASMLRCGEVREMFDSVESSTPKQAKPQDPKPTSRPKKAEPPKKTARLLGRQLTPVWTAYLALQQALAKDDPKAAQASAQRLKEQIAGVAPEASARAKWDELRIPLEKAVAEVAANTELEAQRAAFERASTALTRVFEQFGHDPKRAVRRFRCPMAFDGRGGEWLQEDEATLNPYYGKSMLRCGDQVAELPARGAR